MSIDIKQRFIEAADIEHRMRGPRGPSGPRTAWPVHQRERADVDGWFGGEDDDAIIKATVTSAEISAHDEVMVWMRTFIASDADRRLAWTWSGCQASGKSFADYCRERRIDPDKTMIRVDRIFDGVAAKVSAAAALPRRRHLIA